MDDFRDLTKRLPSIRGRRFLSAKKTKFNLCLRDAEDGWSRVYDNIFVNPKVEVLDAEASTFLKMFWLEPGRNGHKNVDIGAVRWNAYGDVTMHVASCLRDNTLFPEHVGKKNLEDYPVVTPNMGKVKH